MVSDGWTAAFNLVVGSGSCGTNSRAARSPRLADDGYHLLPGSPARGAGDHDLHPVFDIDGDFRPLNVAPDAGADQSETALIVLGRSIGAARIGMLRPDVLMRYGRPARSRYKIGQDKSKELVDSYRLHGGALTFTYRDDTTVGLSTTSRYYTTASGVGPGVPAGADAAWTRPLRWIACRKVYRARANGLTIEYVVGGRLRRDLLQISMLRGAPQQCR